MFEFLIATGKYGVLGVAGVFIVVFCLAKPGEEISFWGIKFHKKPSKPKKPKFKKPPTPVPADWSTVLDVIAHLDDHFINEARIFEGTRKSGALTELQTRKVLTEMSKCGLVRTSANYVIVEETSFETLSALQVKRIQD